MASDAATLGAIHGQTPTPARVPSGLQKLGARRLSLPDLSRGVRAGSGHPGAHRLSPGRPASPAWAARGPFEERGFLK